MCLCGHTREVWRRECIGREITAVMVEISAARVSVRAPVPLYLLVFSSPCEFMWIHDGKETAIVEKCYAIGFKTLTWNLRIMEMLLIY